MSQLEIQQEQLRQLQTLHARTCALMTKFIDGYQCPKLSHLIVSQLGQLISYTQSLHIMSIITEKLTRNVIQKLTT